MAKPRRLLSRLVPLFPSVLADPLPPGAFHPVPVALSEVGKLCEMEQSCTPADLELIGQTGFMPGLRGIPRNPVLPPALAIHATPAPRLPHQRVPTRCSNRLRAPRFELLRPSVVVRRRPQRHEPSIGT